MSKNVKLRFFTELIAFLLIISTCVSPVVYAQESTELTSAETFMEDPETEDRLVTDFTSEPGSDLLEPIETTESNDSAESEEIVSAADPEEDPEAGITEENTEAADLMEDAADTKEDAEAGPDEETQEDGLEEETEDLKAADSDDIVLPEVPINDEYTLTEENAEIFLKYKELAYNEKPRTQSSTTVVTLKTDDKEIELVQGTDYTLSYSENNTDVGTVTVTATGIGKYKGSITAEFKITPGLIRQALNVADTLFYMGVPKTQNNTVVRAWQQGTWRELTRDQDYTITYENNVNIGKATMIIQGIGNYTGEIVKTFSIIPRKTYIMSLETETGSRKVTVNWAKQSDCTTGYQIQYATDSAFTENANITIARDPEQVTKAISNLLPGQTWYLRIRTYTITGGTIYYSPWSAAKSILVSGNAVTGSGSMRTLYFCATDPSITGLKAAVWSKTGGQDDLVWYTMTKESGSLWTARISLSTINHEGTCHVHVYNASTYVGAVNFTVPAEDVKNAVNERVRDSAKALLDAVGNTLRDAYNWAVNTIVYQSLVTPISVPKDGPYAGLNRQELYFIYAYENHKGNCFCYAGTVYWLARELGYDVRLIEGQCVWSYGGYGPHSWVELYQDGNTYILDPEINREKGWDGYMKTYSNGPDLGYRPDLPAY